MDVTSAIKALGKAAESGFSFVEKLKDKQSESAIIKFAKEKIKAITIAEKIIILCFKYYYVFSEEDQEKFNKLLNDFIRHN